MVGTDDDEGPDMGSTERQADELMEALMRLPDTALPAWLESIDQLNPIQQGDQVL